MKKRSSEERGGVAANEGDECPTDPGTHDYRPCNTHPCPVRLSDASMLVHDTANQGFAKTFACKKYTVNVFTILGLEATQWIMFHVSSGKVIKLSIAR